MEQVLNLDCLINEVEKFDSEKQPITDCEKNIEVVKTTWFQTYAYRKSNYLEKGLALIDKSKVLKSNICPDLVG